MVNFAHRFNEASEYFNRCKKRLNSNKQTPPQQKFAIGQRVKIANVLCPSMSHFQSGVYATVQYTYGQMFGGDDDSFKEYSLIINGKSTAWYPEKYLSVVE